jgi:TonB family protein
MKMTKEELYGYTGSSIFCLLIFFLLYLTVMKTTVKAGEEGILVNFGTVDLSSGTFEPKSGAPQDEIDQPKSVQPVVPKPKTPPVARTQPQKNTTQPITQNREKTVAIEAERKKQEEKKRIEAEQQVQRAQAEAEQRKRNAINQQVSGAFGSATTEQNQRGTGTSGSGIQGNPQSTTSAGSPSGTGYGEFNLGGRSLGAGGGLPRPAYTVQEEGRIVINITVDPNGNVIFAEIGRGTNIDNANMRNSALEAARKAKFNSINGNNNQSGTITYRYSLK